MAQGALNQPGAQTVPGYPGPWVVQPSWLEYAGKLANQGVAAWKEGKARREQDAKNQALVDALRKSWGQPPEQAVPAPAAPPVQAPFAQPPGMPVQPDSVQPAPGAPVPPGPTSLPAAPGGPPPARSAQSPGEPMLAGVPLATWMSASPDQRQLMAQLTAEREKERESQAYVFKPTGEIDLAATQRNLAAISPRLGMQFQRDQQQYETTMTKRATENEEVQRRIRADEERRQKAIRDNAVKGALQQVFDIIQRGGNEQQAIAQGGQFYNAALHAGGLPPERFEPGAMGFTEEGEILSQGGLQQVASKAPPAPAPGLAPTPLEQGGQPLKAPPAEAPGKDYNWQLAYLYTASRLPKYNPQTADIVLDYRTGQPMENLPRTRVAERRAKAGASNVSVGGMSKTMPKAITESLETSFIQAQSALDSQTTVQRIEETLENPNLIAGFGASARLTAAQALNLLSGGSARAEDLAATRNLVQGLADLTLSSRGMLRGQGTVTDREQALLERARGGDFNMSVPELKELMDVFSRMNRAQYDKHMSALNRARRLPGSEESGLEFFTPDPFPERKRAVPRGALPSRPGPQPLNPQPRKSAPAGGAIDFNQLK